MTKSQLEDKQQQFLECFNKAYMDTNWTSPLYFLQAKALALKAFQQVMMEEKCCREKPSMWKQSELPL